MWAEISPSSFGNEKYPCPAFWYWPMGPLFFVILSKMSSDFDFSD
jgi:hypothetical protein